MWEGGIRMDLREIGLGGVDWIRLSQDRDWWRAVECGDESSGSCATELVSYNWLLILTTFNNFFNCTCYITSNEMKQLS
jgi:hypothetical protein